MKMRSAIILLLACGPVVAATWTGYLVGSKCYGAEERNVGPGDTMPHADSDMDHEIRYCVASVKTKEFAIVGADWIRLKFDGAGNTKAAELVRQIGKKPFLRVNVSGDWNNGAIVVKSISVAPPGTPLTTESSPIPGR